MVRFVIASGLIGVLIASPVKAAEHASNNENVLKVWETDFSGRPPFKRVMKTVPVEDIASLEFEREQMETELKRVVNFNGKPPFNRSMKEVEIVEAASLEIVDPLNAEADNPRRNKTRFKRHR